MQDGFLEICWFYSNQTDAWIMRNSNEPFNYSLKNFFWKFHTILPFFMILSSELEWFNEIILCNLLRIRWRKKNAILVIKKVLMACRFYESILYFWPFSCYNKVHNALHMHQNLITQAHSGNIQKIPLACLNSNVNWK